VLVEVWSDIVCPWCYIGKRNLDAALARFDGRDEVEVRWRSFELDPNAPLVRSRPYLERIARKYAVPVEQAQTMVDRMVAAGRDAGIELRFDRAVTGNTFDAHRVVHLAGARGLQSEVKERLFAAALTDGKALGDRDTLHGLAVAAGLDGDEVAHVLDGDDYGAAVRADEREAMEHDVTGVPFFLVDEHFAIPGAQASDLLLRVLSRARR